MEKSSFVIGITGGTGAGKTRLVNHLTEKIPSEKVTVLTQDNYYRPRDTQPLDDRGIKNFDTLESLYPEKLANDIRSLVSGSGFQQQVYHFNNPNAEEQWITVNPAPVIIVEGLYALSYPEIIQLTDMTIFIDVSEDTMLERRISRDFAERGYPRDDVEYRFHNHFLPAYKEHVLPVRENATFVISNDGDFSEAIAELEDSILSTINILR